LQSIASESRDITSASISVLRTNDAAGWERLSKRFRNVGLLNQTNGRVDAGNSPVIAGTRQPLSWLSYEVTGTSAGAIAEAFRGGRAFLSVFLSYVGKNRPGKLMKTLWETSESCVGYGRAPGGLERWSVTSPGALAPPFGDPVVLDGSAWEFASDWYAKYLSSGNEARGRATTAGQFVHRAVMSRVPYDEFIFYFIALDAMFGERGRVESSISSSICQVFPTDLSWERRFAMLFDLRSQLLHGGNHDIALWPELANYRRKFRSTPLADISHAALSAYSQFFQIAPEAPASLPEI